MTEYSERLKKFIKENLPESEKIFVGEILERAKANNLKIVEHKSFFVIYPEVDKNVGLVLDKAVDTVKIKYSTKRGDGCYLFNTYVVYHPSFGEEAVLFNEPKVMNFDFWNFLNELLRKRVEAKEISLPEQVMNIRDGKLDITVFKSEANEYLARQILK